MSNDNNQTNMNNTTTIKWNNAKLNDEFLRINQDGSFKVKEDAPLMFVIGELVHAFLRQQEQIKRLEDAGDEVIYKTNLFDREAHWFKAKEDKS